jgi:hypothetical protein
MSDQNKQSEEKPKKLDLKHFDITMLVDMYANAKAKKDQKEMRRINYELTQRGKSIRKYSSTIKGLMMSRMDIE